MNYDQITEEEMKQMTEDEFFAFLDLKAKSIRDKAFIKPLSPYHHKLAKAVSGEINKNKNN
jgi:hypothetical protein